MRNRKYVFPLIIAYFLGLCFFFKGFFPSVSVAAGAIYNDTIPHSIEARYTHLVIMLIDAFRADFVLEKNSWSKSMPYTRSKIDNGETYSYRAEAKAPTVTMPRIKALMSGMVPSFGEMLSNADSHVFKEDNLIHQMHKKNMKIVFYGDDTWLKLFPSQFLRHEGTSSFYVEDYTEVDDNVTRHLPFEFKQMDWQVMILHYLGLDHIGHTAGPTSPKIPHKLHEMDLVIKKVVNEIKERDVRRGTSSLFAVMGDHGMSNMGSHGGVTIPEVMTPFIIFDAMNTGQHFTNKQIRQVDIAPTLAVLLGLKIPAKSVGQPVLDFFENTITRKKILQNTAQQLYPLYSNLPHQPYSQDLLSIYYGNYTFSNNYAEVLIEKISTELHDQVADYNITFMLMGVFLMGVSTLTSVLLLFSSLVKTALNPASKGDKYLKLYQLFTFTMALFSSLSSSFIEEKQCVWYYFTSQLFIILCVLCRRNHRVPFVALALLVRLMVSFQNTGVQWIGVRDLSDWLNDHQSLNLSVLAVSYGIIYSVLVTGEKNVASKIIFSFGYVNILFHHSHRFKVFSLVPYDGILAARLVMVSILLLFCSQHHFKTSMALIVLLMVRQQSVPWFCTLVCFERLFYTCIHRFPYKFTDWQLFTMFFSISRVVFFSQGNSNSLSTIDVSASVIGMYHFHRYLALCFFYLSVYSGQLYVWASCYDSLKTNFTSKRYMLDGLLVYHLIEGTVYGTLMFKHRYHISVWSVFTPGFFYQMTDTITALFVWTFSAATKAFVRH